jgi:Ca2+-binding EF-hand superfamily protein
LAGIVSALGILVKDVDLIAIMRELDTNKKGYLEFEDFSQFILVDPYTKY